MKHFMRITLKNYFQMNIVFIILALQLVSMQYYFILNNYYKNIRNTQTTEKIKKMTLKANRKTKIEFFDGKNNTIF